MKKLFTNKILQCFILLIFVLLLHISLGYKLRPFYVLTFTAFLLCLSGYFKRTYFIFIILLMMVGAIYSPIGLKYGSPNINSIISIFYTNTHTSRHPIGALGAYISQCTQIRALWWFRHTLTLSYAVCRLRASL